ncbi:hypothetical protein L227DRAFT_153105 [Lentinus tigrinus ALCF2SS1-6]|uniref:Uncharacterized protein n=1 Tax=Lentinus tigrinus ALCF2SS1-6 TaxID=1328759 RepID=A0A5C2S796_9APHY|nr:hypothetical protein L227DRAFT_153105 [Lentinus tigrinus ALCF2SS1-6]
MPGIFTPSFCAIPAGHAAAACGEVPSLRGQVVSSCPFCTQIDNLLDNRARRLSYLTNHPRRPWVGNLPLCRHPTPQDYLLGVGLSMPELFGWGCLAPHVGVGR